LSPFCDLRVVSIPSFLEVVPSCQIHRSFPRDEPFFCMLSGSHVNRHSPGINRADMLLFKKRVPPVIIRSSSTFHPSLVFLFPLFKFPLPRTYPSFRLFASHLDILLSSFLIVEFSSYHLSGTEACPSTFPSSRACPLFPPFPDEFPPHSRLPSLFRLSFLP